MPLEFGIEFRDQSRMRGREIAGFAGVGGQIVELPGMGSVSPLMKQPDQLPIAPMDRGARRQPVGHVGRVGKIREHRTAIEGPARDRRADVDTVDPMPVRQ